MRLNDIGSTPAPTTTKAPRAIWASDDIVPTSELSTLGALIPVSNAHASILMRIRSIDKPDFFPAASLAFELWKEVIRHGRGIRSKLLFDSF